MYRAQGLIEAIMAILITGLAVVALMAVTTRSLGQVARNEIMDQITQEAVLGSNLVDDIVERRNAEQLFGTSYGDEVESTIFSSNSNFNNCYHLDGDLTSPYLQDTPPPTCKLETDFDGNYGIVPQKCLSSWDSVSIDNRETSDYDYSSTMFRIMCIDNSSEFVATDEPLLLVSRIYTGTRSCQDIDVVSNNISEKNEPCVLNEYTAVHTLEKL